MTNAALHLAQQFRILRKEREATWSQRVMSGARSAGSESKMYLFQLSDWLSKACEYINELEAAEIHVEAFRRTLPTWAYAISNPSRPQGHIRPDQVITEPEIHILDNLGHRYNEFLGVRLTEKFDSDMLTEQLEEIIEFAQEIRATPTYVNLLVRQANAAKRIAVAQPVDVAKLVQALITLIGTLTLAVEHTESTPEQKPQWRERLGAISERLVWYVLSPTGVSVASTIVLKQLGTI